MCFVGVQKHYGNPYKQDTCPLFCVRQALFHFPVVVPFLSKILSLSLRVESFHLHR